MGEFTEKGGILEPERDLEEGVLASRCGVGCVPFMEGKSPWTHNDTVLKGQKFNAFFQFQK